MADCPLVRCITLSALWPDHPRGIACVRSWNTHGIDRVLGGRVPSRPTRVGGGLATGPCGTGGVRMTTTVAAAGGGSVKNSAPRPRSAALGEEDGHVRDATSGTSTAADASRLDQPNRVGRTRGNAVDAKSLSRTAIVAVREHRLLRVLVVDRSSVFRDAVRDVLDDNSDMDVVIAVASVAEAADQVEQLAPDVAVLGVDMRGAAGIRLLREVRLLAPRMGLVALAAARYGPSDEELSTLGRTVRLFKGGSIAAIASAVRRVAHVAAHPLTMPLATSEPP
jgi:CheY-like chemotaxis protein